MKISYCRYKNLDNYRDTFYKSIPYREYTGVFNNVKKVSSNKITQKRLSYLYSTVIPTTMAVALSWDSLLERGRYIPPNKATLFDSGRTFIMGVLDGLSSWFKLLLAKTIRASYWFSYVFILFGMVCGLLGIKKGYRMAVIAFLIFVFLCMIGGSFGLCP